MHKTVNLVISNILLYAHIITGIFKEYKIISLVFFFIFLLDQYMIAYVCDVYYQLSLLPVFVCL